MTIKDTMTGKEAEKMPNLAFRMMAFIFNLRDIFFSIDKRLDSFGIKEGFVIVDYGCGTGSFIKRASKLVGADGLVYAVDIHPLSIEAVSKKIIKNGLNNVKPLLADGYSCDISDNDADMIYALDMFHMIKNPSEFLQELHRILKKEGTLIIEYGHQPRAEAKAKIMGTQLWNITEEGLKHTRCQPIHS
ncbi:MAG: class I SAM-dependent methyltransferase [candidate division Zixibacteria bacterium]|nr:class I SAM-dependent methyltransferase [candidate division Zixibacteria bacterium]